MHITHTDKYVMCEITAVACLHSSSFYVNGMERVLPSRQFQSTSAGGKRDNVQTIQLLTDMGFSPGALRSQSVWPWLRGGLGEAHPLDSVLPPVFTSARTKSFISLAGGEQSAHCGED